MKNPLNEQNPSSDESRIARLSRRGFIVAAAGALSGAALWTLRRAALPGLQPVSAADASPIVTIVEFAANGDKIGKETVPRIVKSDAEWRSQLSMISYEVTRHSGTERAYTGATWNLHEPGIFRCICCDTALFSSKTKYDSGTGWPSFWAPIAKENVSERRDTSFGMERVECHCTECLAHLGHIFDDGPNPTGLRYCINESSLKFVKI